MDSFPHRGEIWWISLDPTKGSEIKKTRPCLIVSRDEYNRSSRTVTIIPITSGKARYSAWEVEIGTSCGLANISHLVLPQIRIAAKERLKRCIGKLSESHFLEIEEKLVFYLGFDQLLNKQAVTITGSSTTGGGTFGFLKTA